MCVMNSDNLQLVEHHHQIVNAIVTCPEIDRVAKNVLTNLASTYNLKDECSKQTRAYIANLAQCSKSTVTRIVAYAERKGWITRTAQYKQVEGESAPRQIANKYEFNLSRLGLIISKKARQERQEQRRKAEMKKQREQKKAKNATKTTQQASNHTQVPQHNERNDSPIQGYELFQQMKKKIRFSGT